MVTVRRPARGVLLAALVLVSVLLAGCGGKDDGVARVKAKGRVVKGGQPLRVQTEKGGPPGDPGLQVLFVKVGTADAGAAIPATIVDAEQGTFDLTGPDGKGIPPGHYRVAVILAPVGGKDQLKGKYDTENSPIERDIKGNEDLVIDLDKPNG